MKKENEPFIYILLFLIGTMFVMIGHTVNDSIVGSILTGFGLAFLYLSGIWFGENRSKSKPGVKNE